MKSPSAKTRLLLYRIAAFAILLVLWWVASWRAGPNFVPNPIQTLQAAQRLAVGGKLWDALWDSLRVYLTGFSIAIAVALPIGLAMGGFRLLGRTLEVYLNALNATPRVAFIPMVIVFLGLGFNAKVFITFLGAVMPILINTYAGVLNSDGELVEMARSSGATRMQIFQRILFPGALPFIVVGLRLGATIGLINTVVAEVYLALSGLGGLLQFYGNTFQMAPYFVVVIMLMAVGVILTQTLRFFEKRMDRWRYTAT
ncbi:MAG: ABC transporter permease [Bauldia sp.]